MAMNSEQANAFKAGSGIDPTVLNKFVLGFVLSVLFLWFAWSVLVVFRGWRSGKVTEQNALHFFISTAILVVFSVWMFAS
ncbi:TIGR03758 family integrating conjugative element protein [Salmonella enterica subsp. enterica serovar Muenchen]|uniref:TIGR03758 family integrating conjugative element protein n=2 Tax=Salmonella enterica I TaxID=59201 RepID=A0A3U7XMZ4_SALMU|nr:TIGR03758 family integrating conjugative element protein [Salmonella enterica]EAA5435552.1 TIGR03758 family integrating conjugative element protein [Salmonella enterica subsp. enterica serovar Muenchen]EBS1998088.1 TIGR03758 family integrating conjugative element protein [Salmonella enterica subsp. enterica serovar Infantis]ECA4662756.1 TIGR03758 family integrating conjugative element protein [Salmonella enterica subsp. enterica serovar Newport]EDC7374011.1 TIGR03758 family integrating conju